MVEILYIVFWSMVVSIILGIIVSVFDVLIAQGIGLIGMLLMVIGLIIKFNQFENTTKEQ